eukprot:Colp12_sorted_trinity150504_noHs@25389
MAKSIRSKAKRKFRAIKREKNAVKEAEKLKNVLTNLPISQTAADEQMSEDAAEESVEAESEHAVAEEQPVAMDADGKALFLTPNQLKKLKQRVHKKVAHGKKKKTKRLQ